MKKFIYSALCFCVLWLSLIWFSYWIDCSLYDDLINTIEAQINNLKMRAQRESNWHFTQEQVWQVLWTSKYADEYNSLIKEYNSAVQQKENCLNNPSTSASDYSNNNSYNKSQNQICKEEFWIYSIAIWDECGCKNWYWWDSPEMNRCIAIENSCKWRFWSNTIRNWSECSCNTWFIRNETLTKCVMDTLAQRNLNCSSYYSWPAHAEGDECICDDWYTLNEDKSKCVEDTIKQKKLNCPARYWSKSVYSEDNHLCICSNWYIFNEKITQCVKETVEQRKLNCPTRFDWKAYYSEQEHDCICNDWYIYDEEYNACLVDLSQKSLQSRIMNTNDAKCDTTQIISNCSKDPTWDSCPAVCLELYDAINWMYENKLTIYNDPTKFGIYNPITREQASKFFVNFYIAAFDKVLSIPIQNPFKDIENADPTLYRYILSSYSFWLFKWNNGKFMPFNHLTKAQALAVMIRMATWILDESQQPRYSNYLYKAESMKLLDNINYSYTTLDNEDIVRWDVALILYRLFDYLEQ